MSEELVQTRTRLPSFHPNRPKWSVKDRRYAEYLNKYGLGFHPDIILEVKADEQEIAN